MIYPNINNPINDPDPLCPECGEPTTEEFELCESCKWRESQLDDEE